MNTQSVKNRLQFESSPYLKQHEHNPVDWHAWGDEAISLAKANDKLILLSIGYSSCHWCHVMAHESFEDDATARVMNDLFVNVKVDREERPDIDEVYMEAVQMLTGHGGWPLTVILTPDLKPLFGGTYFPPVAKYGQPSFKDVLQAVNRYYREQRSESDERVSEIVGILKSRADNSKPAQSSESLNADELLPQYLLLLEQLMDEADKTHGGFGHAPKFPQPSKISALLFASRFEYRSHALFTLQKMRSGGICDVLAGGFSRYSVDEHWTVPHFEKMLYDNVQLLSLYAEGSAIASALHQQNGKDLSQTAYEIFHYLEDDLKCKKTLLYFSAEDADSEGVEGKFYVFGYDELLKIFEGDKNWSFISSYFDFKKEGNFEGHNIAERPVDTEAFAAQHNLTSAQMDLSVGDATRKLLEHRNKRVRPGLDFKCLLSWNALGVTGLIRSALALHDKKIMQRGLELLGAIERFFVKDETVYHVHTAGESKISAFCDDLAFLMEAYSYALLATGASHYLTHMIAIARKIEKEFVDQQSEVIYFSAADSRLPFRPVKPEDNVIYSPLSAIARACEQALAWVGVQTNQYQLEETDTQLLKTLSRQAFANAVGLAKQAPIACAQLLQVARWKEQNRTMLVEATDAGVASFEHIADAYREALTHNCMVANSQPLQSSYALSYFNEGRHGATTYSYCDRNGCQLPTKNLNEIFHEG